MEKRTSPDSTKLADLAGAAIAELQLVDAGEPALANQERVVRSASVVEEMARLLRDGSSGRDVILGLLLAAYPIEVSSTYLRHASGIQEFARRIRELRVELGYDVDATSTGYRLLSPEPDVDIAEKWTVMNEIRRRSASAIERIEALFYLRLGKVVTTSEIEYVSKISSGPRRVRELRTEYGFRIESHKDNPNLHPGEYVLVDPEPIPAAERLVDAAQRERILVRDGHACVLCGRVPDRNTAHLARGRPRGGAGKRWQQRGREPANPVQYLPQS